MDFLARLVAFVLLFLAGTAMSSSPSNASTTRHLRGPMWKEGDMLLTGSHLKWTSERGEIRVNGQPFHLKGIAWYGMETRDRTLHGLQSREVDHYLDMLAGWGFNALRLPISLRMALDLGGHVKIRHNKWMPAKQLIETVVDKAAERGIVILLDMHRAGDDEKFELWYTDKYRMEDLKRGWLHLLQLVQNKWNIMGVDLINEPYGRATWGRGDMSTDWNTAAIDLSLFIINNCHYFRGLFFVQGVGGNINGWESFWGGNLDGVRRHPIDLTFEEGNRRIVYSPHTYGPAVVEQRYFNLAESFPQNLPAIWDAFWGFVEQATGRAVVVGEWGGPLAGKNQLFEEALAQYLVQKCMSDTFYWCLNPGSHDTGGLLRHDWTRPMRRRLKLLTVVQPHPSRIRRSQDNHNFIFSPGQYANPACRQPLH